MTPIELIIFWVAVFVVSFLLVTSIKINIRIDKTEERIKALEVREKAREAK